VADVADYVRNNLGSGVVRLAYINCCLGDAGGFLGAGRQLGACVPAVVTNRTIAMIGAARAQALEFWEQVLLKGLAPHQAIQRLYRGLTDLGLSVADARWLTPALHCGYDVWRANPPQPLSRLDHDPHWDVKVDRVTQFNAVAQGVRDMLFERKPRSLAFVWYGQPGQGVDIFHQRLTVEFHEKLTATVVHEARPEWPLELANARRSFADMLTEAFEVRRLDDIPARIRARSQGEFGRQTLVYVRHQPVTSPQVLNLRTLKCYLDWWNAEFMPLFDQTQVFFVLGVSFVVNNPPKLHHRLTTQGFDALFLDHTVVFVLDAMERVAKRDLLAFLHTHNIRLPEHDRDRRLDHILEKTGGHYEQTVAELRRLAEQPYDFSAKDDGGQDNAAEDDDY
jgi:hypothetical protein